MKKFKINYVNCYCATITLMFIILAHVLMIITTNLSNRIDILENQIQKNEAVINDANHLVQLHY